MLLTVDVGNTNVTLGVFESDQPRATWRLATDIERLADEYGGLILSLFQHESLSPSHVTEAAMTCVVPELEPVFQTVCRRYFNVTPLVVGVGTKTGLRILYDTPRDVGADRVVDAVAAIQIYGPPLIVVDIGTATVFDAINAMATISAARSPRARHRLRGADPAGGKTLSRRVHTPAVCYRQEHSRGAPGWHDFWLRRPSRGHRHSHQGGAGRRGESHRYRRLCPNNQPRDGYN